jgi:hypothetical protein
MRHQQRDLTNVLRPSVELTAHSRLPGLLRQLALCANCGHWALLIVTSAKRQLQSYAVQNCVGSLCYKYA